jgi:hypothetical protein
MTVDLLPAGPAPAPAPGELIPLPGSAVAGSDDPRLGLHVSLLRPADVLTRLLAWGDQAARESLSFRFDQAVVVGVCHSTGGPPVVEPLPAASQVSAPSQAAPAVWLERAVVGVPVWAVIPAMPPGAEHDPAALEEWVARWEAGPSYAASADSRLRRIIGFYGAVAVHDHDRRPPTRHSTTGRPAPAPAEVVLAAIRRLLETSPDWNADTFQEIDRIFYAAGAPLAADGDHNPRG